MIAFSLILPTCGRAELAAAARAAARQMTPADELIIVGGGDWGAEVAEWCHARHLPHAGGHDWGNSERNAAMPEARGSHLVFIDDDDALVPGALAAMRQRIEIDPHRPHIFRMITPEGLVLPDVPRLAEAHIGTPCMVPPNLPGKLGTWGTRYESDYDYIVETISHYPAGPVWHDVIVYACREHGRRAWGLS